MRTPRRGTTWTCGMRGRHGRRTHGLPHAAADDGPRQDGRHVVQPRRGRRRKGSDRTRNRRSGRAYGTHNRLCYNTIPHAQPFEGPRHVEPPRAVRQGSLLASVAARGRTYRPPCPVAGCRRQPHLRHLGGASTCHGSHHPHGRRVHRPRRHPHQRHIPLGTNALRRAPRRGRPCRRRRLTRHNRIAPRHGLRGRPHEDRHTRTNRRPNHRLHGHRAAGG